jgi:hypothetical protein
MLLEVKNAVLSKFIKVGEGAATAVNMALIYKSMTGACQA